MQNNQIQLDKNVTIVKYSKYELTEMLISLEKRIGKLPSKHDWVKDNLTPSDILVRRVFGCWSNFLAESGFKPRKYGIVKNLISSDFLKSELAVKTPNIIAIENKVSRASIYSLIKKYELQKSNRIYESKSIIGLKIGDIEIVERSTDIVRITKYGRKYYTSTWMGKCSCGSVKSYEINSILKGVKDLESGRHKYFSCGCKKTLPYGEGCCRRAFGLYKRGALYRGYCFEITVDDFKSITKMNCHYCGASPKNKATSKSSGNTGDYIYNGIDRVDNAKGYLLNNVVPCCKICNRAKNSLGVEVFLNWIAKAYNHSFSKPANTLINHSFGNINQKI